MRYGMVIDLDRCIGCHACSVACKSNNNLPNNVWYNRVETDGGAFMDTARGTYPSKLEMSWIPIACQHCGNPACLSVCPTESISKREDGIVLQDNESCIACQLCIEACPYGVRTLIEEEPEYALDFKLGDWDAPEHTANTVEKCTFCVNRIDRESMPACMELCLGRARFWGDFDDPESEASKYLVGKEASLLLEDKGTGPNVYYIKKA